MREGSPDGSTVEVGPYAFRKDKPATVTVATLGANGNVIADSVGFVMLRE